MDVARIDRERSENRNWRTISLAEWKISGAELVSVAHINSRLSNRQEHEHKGRVELNYCCRGDSLGCSRNGKLDILHPGEIFVAFPGEQHCILDGPKGRITFTLLVRLPKRGSGLFGFTACETKMLVGRLRSANRLFAVRNSVASSFQTILRICDDRKMDRGERRMRLQHELDCLFLAICDDAVRGIRAARTRCLEMSTIAAEMSENPFGEYPLDALCARLNVSKPNFIRHFKVCTGCTPHAYLLRCRIERAKQMLGRKTEVTIVAHQLGFSSVAHFSRVFRESTGVCPSKWKN